jgi:hypothetical protein
MSQLYPRQKQTMNKNNRMFSSPLMKKISNVVCPDAPIKSARLTEIIIDDGNLHEVVIAQRKLLF